MNQDASVARRYADALFQVALKRDEVDEVVTNLHEVAAAVQGSRELMSALHHPLLTQEKKQSIVKGVFGQNVHADVVRFLFLVIQKDRAILLPQIVEEFDRFVDEYRGEADALATSAVPLTPQQIAHLETALNEKFGVKVRLKTKVDESILGGLIVRVGDKLIDSSVATRLQQMNEQLKRVKVT